MKPSTAAVCLAAFFLSPVQAKDDDSSCFKQKGDIFLNEDHLRVATSPMRKCSKDESNCGVNSEDVHVTAERWLNVTTDKADDVFDVISEATSLAFEESISEETGSGGGCSTRTSGTLYNAFLPVYDCVEGILGSCVDGLEPGTPIKACSPAKSGNELRGNLQCVVLNGTNKPDVKYKPLEGSASGLTADIKFLSVISFMAAGGAWALLPV